jgi:hypothetical protein
MLGGGYASTREKQGLTTLQRQDRKAEGGLNRQTRVEDVERRNGSAGMSGTAVAMAR